MHRYSRKDAKESKDSFHSAKDTSKAAITRTKTFIRLSFQLLRLSDGVARMMQKRTKSIA